MTDKIFQEGDESISVKYKDNGDGSYTPYVEASVTIPVGDGLTDTQLRASSIAVKGTGFSIPATLTVTNGVYSISDVAGGLITFAGALSGAGKRAVIHTITLGGVVALDYDLWFFPSNIATPATDNAPFTLSSADIAMCKGTIPIRWADYATAQNAFSIATIRGCAFEFSCTGTTLYAYLVPLATTSPATTTLTLTISGEYLD